MADTDFGGFSPVTSLLTTDQFLALRAGGGINFTLATLAAEAAKLAGDGTVAAPGIAFSGDTDTGIYRPGNNAIGIVTAGSERVRVDSSGNVSIGTSNSGGKLHTALGTTFSWGSAWDSSVAVFGGSSAGAGGLGISYNDTDGGIIGAVSPSVAWRRLSLYASDFKLVGGGSVDRLTIDGSGTTTLAQGSGIAYVRTSTGLLLQHDGSDAYVRANTGFLNLGAGGANVLSVGGADLTPKTDNAVSLGTGANRYSVLYAATGSINTSDELSKQQIDEIPDEWLDAWGDIEWSRYKFNDAVDAKGDDARWHLGLVAQRVRDAFADRDLDATTIGLLCYDEWEEEREPIYEEGVIGAETVVIGQEPTGVLDASGNPVMRDITEERDVIGQIDTGETRVTLEAGDRWGLRYDECFAMEAAWQRREIARERAAREAMEARLAALEAA